MPRRTARSAATTIMQARNELFDFMGVSVMSAVEKFKQSFAKQSL